MNMSAINFFFSVALIAAANFIDHASSFSSPPSLLQKIDSSSFQSNILYPNKNLRYSSKIHASGMMSNDDLISSLLNNNNGNTSGGKDKDPYSRYTHQIAIPLSDASELHSALHPIQTSLVRDCPRLIRACIMPALLRMPLLYVDGSTLETANGGILGGSGTSDNDGSVDAILEGVVHGAIREVIYGEKEEGNNKQQMGGGSSSPVVSIDTVADPILLPFRGLELQGEDNSVLYAVGNNINDITQKKKSQYDIDDEDDGVIVVDEWSSSAATTEATNTGPSGWEILEKLVLNIQNELESKYGLSTCWPLDEPQGEEIYDDPMVAAIKAKQRKWRPRVPFVRLPTDFYQDLKDDMAKRGDANEEDDDAPSPIDMGLDGISPQFWYDSWAEEDITEGVRMPSVAVYRRIVPGGGEAESSFYVPNSSASDRSTQPWNNSAGSGSNSNGGKNNMELPVGDSKLTARERREKAKAMERLGEEEQRAEREWEQGKARWMEEMNDPSFGGDMEGGSKSVLDEDSFAQFDVGMETGEVTVEGDAAYSSPWSERGVDDSLNQAGGDTTPDEEFSASDGESSSADNNQATSELLDTPSRAETKTPKELPSIENNPIFQRLWKGQTQVASEGQNTAVALDGTPPTEDVPLPPYPSDGHFVGAWRVVSSPLGTEIPSIDSESKSSDNFILRVDGQVMGGPVLNTEYQHKAAGGSWRMFQARRKSAGDEEVPIAQTRLRIRLLVPPEKERALVMEGEVTRMVMPGAGDASSSPSDGWMLASGGMLDGMIQNLDVVDSSTPGPDSEGLLYCGGEAWTEDLDGLNRRKIGPFSLMKLKSIDRKNLIYTVDVARPTASEGDEDAE